jgi:hypothetical protein
MGVFRICWAMTMFFLGMSVIMIGVKNGSDWRRGLQNGYGCNEACLFAFVLLEACLVS